MCEPPLLVFRVGGGAKENKHDAPTRRWIKFDDMHLGLDTVPHVTDRQTDRRTTVNQDRAVCMLTRDNKYTIGYDGNNRNTMKHTRICSR